MGDPAGHPRTMFGSPLHLASICCFQRVHARWGGASRRAVFLGATAASCPLLNILQAATRPWPLWPFFSPTSGAHWRPPPAAAISRSDLNEMVVLLRERRQYHRAPTGTWPTDGRLLGAYASNREQLDAYAVTRWNDPPCRGHARGAQKLLGFGAALTSPIGLIS
jgi:hypothetical protein